MSGTVVLELVNVFFAGILAGAEIILHDGSRAPADVLDEPSQIRFRQALVRRLRVLVPACFVPAALPGMAGCAKLRRDSVTVALPSVPSTSPLQATAM